MENLSATIHLVTLEQGGGTFDAHIEADGQTVKLDDDFTVDGIGMEFPGDPKGGAGNVCNCLCMMAPKVGEL